MTAYCWVDDCSAPATVSVRIAEFIDALVCEQHAPDPDAVPYAAEPPDKPATHTLQPRDDGGHFQPLVLDPWGRVVVWSDA